MYTRTLPEQCSHRLLQYSTAGWCNSNALDQWFPKCAVPRTSSKGIRTYFSLMITLKFAHYLNWRQNILLKNNRRCVYFLWPLDYLVRKLPVHKKGATVIWIKVKSCNELLRMPQVCIRIYLNSVLIYKYLILNTYHPDTLHLREQGCEDPCLFFEAERDPRADKLGNNALDFHSWGSSSKEHRISWLLLFAVLLSSWRWWGDNISN